jgi:hypothetical protein
VVGMKMTVKNMGDIENGGLCFQQAPHGTRTGIKQQS